MELFQEVQKKLSLMGICSNQSISMVNRKSVMTWLILTSGAVSGAAFLLFEAETLLEYIGNLYFTFSIASMNASFTLIILKKRTFFEVIDRAENMFNQSE